MAVVEDFLERYNAQDWDALAQCFSPTGFMHDIVSAMGAPISWPRLITSVFCHSRYGVSIRIS